MKPVSATPVNLRCMALLLIHTTLYQLFLLSPPLAAGGGDEHLMQPCPMLPVQQETLPASGLSTHTNPLLRFSTVPGPDALRLSTGSAEQSLTLAAYRQQTESEGRGIGKTWLWIAGAVAAGVLVFIVIRGGGEESLPPPPELP